MCVHGCGNKYSIKDHPKAHRCIFSKLKHECVFYCEVKKVNGGYMVKATGKFISELSL